MSAGRTEAGTSTKKENAPAMTEAQGKTSAPDSTAPLAPHALYNPLTWRPDLLKQDGAA
ncbi:hypothetical protein [Thauera propionica]|uniref:hypothetical protein n=1 Tax=Thauera propionica TaxID=2019431 RepID=UPI0013FE3F31|nr:hypothetical protein [Thauera propionica]